MDAFEEFWERYPRKVGKGVARKQFMRALTKTDLATMLAALAWQATQPQWSKDGGQYCPHPSTWLSQERWEDAQPSRIQTHSAIVARALEALERDHQVALRRDELLRQGKSRAEASAILEAEAEG